MDLDFLKDIQRESEKAGMDWAYKGIWNEPPVDFITFSRDWLGECLFPGPQENFSHNVLGVPSKDKLWEDKYNTGLLGWGKGAGKDALSAKLLTYSAYLLLNMRDPRAYFKIGKTAPIHMLNISYNSTQAKQVFFNGYLIPAVLNCINPRTKVNFFAEKGVDLRVNEGDILSREIHFERPTGEGEGGIIAASLGGDKATAEGYSPLFIFVDEYSAMQNPVKAEKLVDDLEASAVSRYGSKYKLIVASFKRGRNCLMSLKIGECEKNNTPGVYISKESTWSVNKLKRKDDFARIYATNPVSAARTYEFSEVEGMDENVFFTLIDRLTACFGSTENNPFEGDVITCRSDQLEILEFKQWFQPKFQVHYHCHIDLAKGKGTDRAALAITHKEGLESFKDGELDRYISGELLDKKFKVSTDMILQITASKAGEIILEEIRLFIIKLFSKGFKLKVTLDGFQSLDFIQQLNQKGIPCELLSVDRNKMPYETFQSLVYRGDWECYEHPYLLRELEELEESEDGKKIDHPMKSIKRAQQEKIDAGSKDLADAICGSALRSVLSEGPSIPIMPTKGIVEWEGDEDEKEMANFERGLNNGMIEVGKEGKPKSSHWENLMPTRG